MALAIIVYWNAWSSGVAHVSFADGDQYTAMWDLTWTPFALLHGHNPFFSDYVNYPWGANLLTDTAAPLLGFVAAPITLLWGPVASFNVMMTLAMATSAFSGYVFAAHWVKWRPAAVVAGLVYGFSPYMIAQGVGHLFLIFVPLPPLILLFAYRIVVEQNGSTVRDGIVLGLLVVAQCFISTEILADTVAIAFLGLIVIGIAGRHRVAQNFSESVKGFGAAAVVSIVLLAYPIWFALAGPGSISGPVQLVPQAYRADLLGPIVPSSYVAIAPASLLRTSNGFAGNPVENGSYLGVLLLLILAAATILLWRRIEVRVCAILGTAAFIISLGDRLVVSSPSAATPSGHLLPGWLLFHLPLYSNAIPVRYSLFVALFAALLLAIALDAMHDGLLNRGRARLSYLAPFGVAVLALFPIVPAVPYAGLSDITAPSVYTDHLSAFVAPDTPIITYPYSTNVISAPMIWQAQSFMHFKMPGGNQMVPDPNTRRVAYSAATGYYGVQTLIGNVFNSLAAGKPPPRSTALKSAVLIQTRRGHFGAVVATPAYGANPAQAIAYLSWLFGRPVADNQGSFVWKLSGERE
jgi:hypothetical protein